MHTLLQNLSKCMAENYMILISNLNQRHIKLYGLPAMKISFAFVGAYLLLFVIMFYKTKDHILVVISSALKHIYRLKIILQKTQLIFPGNMHLKDNGYFINSGEDYCMIQTLPMIYLKKNSHAAMEMLVSNY